MSDLKLFRIGDARVKELESRSIVLEKSLQTLIEKNLESMLGVRFLVSEYDTGKANKGKIKTLGIDENGSPVIIEYKRSMNENVINQGLYYLDWLFDHEADFELLTLKKLGKAVSDNINWAGIRLICIAGDFTKFDLHAVKQISRNIELVRYRQFDIGFLLLELVNASSAVPNETSEPIQPSEAGSGKNASVTELLERSDKKLFDLFQSLSYFIEALGDDVQKKNLKHYFAFKRMKNFACVEVHPQAAKLLVYVKIAPDKTVCEKGFARDVQHIGHYGTVDLEITLKEINDLEKAKPYIIKSYEKN